MSRYSEKSLSVIYYHFFPALDSSYKQKNQVQAKKPLPL